MDCVKLSPKIKLGTGELPELDIKAGFNVTVPDKAEQYKFIQKSKINTVYNQNKLF